jgi:hypothetical protein
MTTARRFPFSPPSEQELSHLQQLVRNHSDCSQRLLDAYLLNEPDQIQKYKEEVEAAVASAAKYRAWLGLPPAAMLAREFSCAKITKTLALYPPFPEQKLMGLKAHTKVESDIEVKAKAAVTRLTNNDSAENSVRDSNISTRRFR